jgi:hypothetical protein
MRRGSRRLWPSPPPTPPARMPRRKPRPAPRPDRGSVHPLLDLHRLTGEEAVRRTGSWLRARQAENVRTVVVVTGRGRHSGGTPVLRGEVEHLLKGLQGTVVASYEVEGHGGSLRVELCRPPTPPPRVADAEPPLVRTAPASLRRRAEDALAELGVAPTPALVAAEIRRILREESGEE